MPVDSCERRPARAQNSMGTHQPPRSTEPLPCPRCESTNTKFCYYNNYNLSQPRHFCKACRRYWTKGGTLRNVPVGGGTRKNSKRSRSSSSSTSSSSSSVTSTSNLSTLALEPESLPVPVPANPDSVLPAAKEEVSDDLNLNENLPVTENGNFISLLNAQEHGFIGLGGYGSGFGIGSCEVGLGFGGRGIWPYPGMGNISGGNGGVVGVGTSECNTWQLGDVGGGGGGGDGDGLVDGDYFVWPGLAISAPGKGLK